MICPDCDGPAERSGALRGIEYGTCARCETLWPVSAAELLAPELPAELLADKLPELPSVGQQRPHLTFGGPVRVFSTGQRPPGGPDSPTSG